MSREVTHFSDGKALGLKSVNIVARKGNKKILKIHTDMSAEPPSSDTDDVSFVLRNCADAASMFGRDALQSLDLLAKRYRKWTVRVHPDKNAGRASATEAFKLLGILYEKTMQEIVEGKFASDPATTRQPPPPATRATPPPPPPPKPPGPRATDASGDNNNVPPPPRKPPATAAAAPGCRCPHCGKEFANPGNMRRHFNAGVCGRPGIRRSGTSRVEDYAACYESWVSMGRGRRPSGAQEEPTDAAAGRRNAQPSHDDAAEPTATPGDAAGAGREEAPRGAAAGSNEKGAAAPPMASASSCVCPSCKNTFHNSGNMRRHFIAGSCGRKGDRRTGNRIEDFNICFESWTQGR